MRVAYLACAEVLPGAVDRRPDAFEHDQEIAAFRPALEDRGAQLIEVDWRLCDPAAYDLLLVRTTWDYVKHQAEFLDFLQKARTVTPLENPLDVISWNLSKRYLLELIGKGLPVIPSVFVEKPTPVLGIFDTLETDELVLKPVVGAGGFGQSKLRREDVSEGAVMPAALFAQPLIPDIVTAGEISMIFVDGAFSHALRKSPAKGEYRIQVLHGGRSEVHHPTPDEIAAAKKFVDALPAPALACRVDLVPHRGQLLLMELEAIEPHLFPEFGPDLGPLVAQACLNRSLTSAT
ncbi:MAG: hypothetical protein CFE28_07355 [Alphaproteobacteria bacterium PA2]|nr:MAG: hypothetical protein CFE28_07355 [Alphaproteobacteria bacterium PA2]